MACEDFEGTFRMKTQSLAGFWENELIIAVDDSNCRVTGSWRTIDAAGGNSAIVGQITGESIQFNRIFDGGQQTYVGSWANNFAGGTFEGFGGGGVWFMERI